MTFWQQFPTAYGLCTWTQNSRRICPERPRARHAPPSTSQSTPPACHPIQWSTRILNLFYILYSSIGTSSPHTHIHLPFPRSLDFHLVRSLNLLCFDIMMLRATPALSLLNPVHGEALGPLFSSVSSPSSFSLSRLNSSASLASSVLFSHAKKESSFAVCAVSKADNSRPLTGVIFEPFEEVKKELDLVPTVPQVSIARQKFSDECEAALNEQIK